MMRRWVLVITATTLWCAAATAGVRPQQTTFRARTDAVIVHVTVVAGGKPVTGLTPADFHLSDDGVAQDVAFAPVEAVPLDVELVIQTSVSMKNPDRVRADLKTITGLLGPDDQLGLMTFARTVREEVPLQPVSVAELPQPLKARGALAFDALLQALVRPGTPSRIHLVLLVTDGIDASVSRPDDVLAVAGHSDAVVMVAVTGNTYLRVSDPMAPKQTPAPMLTDVSTLTGGTLVHADDLLSAFRQALDAFRHSYVLTYAATNVPRAGWHAITVTLARSGDYRVLARHGYVRR
jgi:hypothetical protein